MRLRIGDVVEIAIDWLKDNLDGFFNFIKAFLSGVIDGFEWIFTLIPFFVFIIIIAIVALRMSGIKNAIFAVVGLLVIQFTNLWPEAMSTLALVFTATFIALIIGVPLGIGMAKHNKLDKAMRPVLDFMQTMPAFVYLIPAVFFFGIGVVPGAVATIIFAMPPIVRLTNLGIRQVPEEVIEASKAFGATSGQMLFKVQIPLAMPTISAGLNQTIMLSLSMVVISAMIGSGGLGQKVIEGVTTMKIGIGFEGGLAVVFLAMILDRITQTIGKKNQGINFPKWIKNKLQKNKITKK